MRDRQVWPLLAVLTVFGLAGTHCGNRADSHQMHAPPPVAVEIATVQRTEIRDLVTLVGQLEPEESVLIKPETDGVIESIGFEDGAEVEQGMVLFRLRADEQQARLREAEAQLVLTADEHRRMKTLFEKGTVSSAELERATAEWQAAEARADRARVELRRMDIRAPFDGVLGARGVSPGDRVSKNMGLVQIDAVDRLRLVFSVPEIAVPAVRVGLPLTVTVAPFPGEEFTGEVYFVAPSLDPLNRRLLLKAWVPNPAHHLRPGFFANIVLEVAHREGALVVPEAAIAYDASGPLVWRIDGENVAERVGVSLGLRQEGRVEIVDGLAAGDRIVSAGVHKVAPGAKVQVAAAVPAESSPPGAAN